MSMTSHAISIKIDHYKPYSPLEDVKLTTFNTNVTSTNISPPIRIDTAPYAGSATLVLAPVFKFTSAAGLPIPAVVVRTLVEIGRLSGPAEAADC